MAEETTSERYADTGYDMKDTSPEVNRMMFEKLMFLSSEKRFYMGISMLNTARQMILASLPLELPFAERKLALFERLYSFPFPGNLTSQTI